MNNQYAAIPVPEWQETKRKIASLRMRFSDAFEVTPTSDGGGIVNLRRRTAPVVQRTVASASRESTFPVLVVWSTGSDGTSSTYASWTYNIYALADTGYTTPLTASPVEPLHSPARVLKGPVTKAADGSEGIAYRVADGTIHLSTCCEKHGSAAKDCG